MKSRKLRALALLLSAIMIITAVPSTLFAFESVDGEVVGWDQETEAPAEDLGELGLGFDSEVEAVAFEDDVDFFAADELVGAENGIEKETWNFAKQTVTIKTKGDEPVVTYNATVEQSKSDCTKVYMKATIKDFNGNDLVIYSNIPSQNWIVDDGAGNVLNPGDTKQEGSTFGTYPSGKDHTWNAGTVFDAQYNCIDPDKNYYRLEYKCTVCGTLGYKETSADDVSADTAKKDAYKIFVKPTGKHTRPEDTSKITTVVTYIASDDSTSLTLDGKTYTAFNSKYIETTAEDGTKTADDTKVPEPKTAGKDSQWIIKTQYEYVCDVCGATVSGDQDYTLVEDGKYIRLVAYAVGANDNVVAPSKQTSSTLTAAGFNLPSTTKIYDGTKWEDDEASFELASCVANGGKGVVTELWYTANYKASEEGTTYIVSREIPHEISAHGRTKKIYRTSAVAVGSYKDVDAISDGLSSLKKICAVKETTTNGKTEVEILSSLSCKDVTYYEIEVCDFNCDKVSGKYKTVLACEKKVAKGNEKAHKYNEDANAVVTFVNANTSPYDIKNLKATVKNNGVVFKNGTYTCIANGTVDAYYVCAVCGKEVFLDTIKVKAPGHDWQWVDIEPKKDATCTAEGFVTQQSQCKVCGIVNTELGTRVATIPALGHDFGKQDYKLKVNPTGTIIGNKNYKTASDVPYAWTPAMQETTGENTEKYDNLAEVNPVLYKTCTRCGKDIASADIETVAANVKTVTDLKVTAMSPENHSCYGGTITIKATFGDLTATGTYEYWKNATSYQARTQHAPKENADGSIVCVICGKVIKEAPVVTTVAPTTVEPTTVVTTEAPTTVAPTTVAPTTTAPTTTAPTTEAPVVPTTVAPVVEPTTEITTEQVTMPAQVTGEKVTKNSPTTGTIGVKYNAVDGADSYTVNVREPNGAWKKNPTNGAETAYDITGLTEGKCYDIRIAAVAGGIAGPRSGHLYRWLKKVTLMKPTKIKGEAGAVNVTWDAADGASLYKLYVSSDKAFKKDVQKIKAAENTAKVTGLKAGTKYYFKVRCYTKAADGKTYTGGWSNVKSKTLK